MLVNTILLISKALVSSSGCGQERDHQGREAIAPTGGAASRGQGPRGYSGHPSCRLKEKAGPQGCPLQRDPSLSGPPTCTVPVSPKVLMTFPLGRVLETPWAPKTIGTGPGAFVPGFRVGMGVFGAQTAWVVPQKPP